MTFEFDLIFGSFHVVEHLSFSMFPSTLAFDFDYIFWSFGVGVEFENCFWVYSCSCSTFILYVFINSGISFYLILVSFLSCWGHNGLILGLG